jgi:hypothetical protein
MQSPFHGRTGTAAVTLAELRFQNQKPVVHRESFA